MGKNSASSSVNLRKIKDFEKGGRVGEITFSDT